MATVAFPHREELVRALFPKGGSLVEVGVQHGDFADSILTLCAPRWLYLIDPWRFISGEYEKDPANKIDHMKQYEYEHCRQRFATDERVVLIRELSQDAVDGFADGVLDGVYLDGDHTEHGINLDLSIWWPKVRSGGVLAGHDYCVSDWIAVQPAVDLFVARNGLELLLSAEEGWPSWAVVKP